MRILCVAPSYPPKVGGGERYTQALAEAAAAAGHEVTVLTSDVAVNPDFWQWHPAKRGQRATVEHNAGITVVRCPAIGIPGGWPSLTLWRKAMVMIGMLGDSTAGLLERMSELIPHMIGIERELEALGPFDLVHGYNLSWEYPLVVARRYARAHRLPFVVTPYAHLGVDVSARVTRNITMPHQLRILREADALLALPSAEAEGLKELGTSPDRVYAVGSGYDPRPGQSVLPPAVAGVSGPVIAFVGRISRDKGAHSATEAVLRLNAQGRHAPTLVLMGPVDEAYARYHARLGAEQRAHILLLGVVSEESKHAVLERAAMLVLPSRVDSFGIVLLEAWAHGRPVIGARAGGIPGVIDDGTDGLLVPWGDAAALAAAIARLLDDPRLAASMGTAGKAKTLAEYTWPAVWRRVEAVYERVTAKREP